MNSLGHKLPSVKKHDDTKNDTIIVFSRWFIVISESSVVIPAVASQSLLPFTYVGVQLAVYLNAHKHHYTSNLFILTAVLKPSWVLCLSEVR